MEDNKLQNDDSYSKREKRSPSMPSHLLSDCIETTKRIYSQSGTSRYIDREQIASILKLSPNSIQTKVASCVQYGLLEMKPSEGYKPSALFLEIHKPFNDKEQLRSKISCFTRPKIYDAIINTYSGDVMPSKNLLATYLFRKQNVSDGASLRAAEIFIENAKDLGLISEDNMFAINSQDDLTTVELNEVPSDNLQKSPPSFNDNANKVDERLSLNPQLTDITFSNNADRMPNMVVNLKGNRLAYINFPKDITSDDCQRVIQFIEFYKGGI